MKRRPQEEHANHERWLVSYADFITLLFAFFVVMYSISSVNEGKYKVLSETLEGAFNAKQRTLKPVQVGEKIPRAEQDQSGETPIHPIFGIPKNFEEKKGEKGTRGDTELKEIAKEFKEQFGGLIKEGKVTVENNGNWIEVSLTNTIVFDSGGVEPIDAALPLVERIAEIMKDRRNGVLVEGYTDNIPIRTSSFPSNWELSAARAASVVRYLALEGVDPDRLSAMGYGEFQPVASNDSAEGRSQNRRVVLLISKNRNVRESLLNSR